MASEKEWYSERELFEMIQGLKHDLTETRAVIKKYNGLWEKINELAERLTTIEQQAVGRKSVGRAVREWGGWIIAVVGFLLLWLPRLLGGE